MKYKIIKGIGNKDPKEKPFTYYFVPTMYNSVTFVYSVAVKKRASSEGYVISFRIAL